MNTNEAAMGHLMARLVRSLGDTYWSPGDDNWLEFVADL